MKTKPQSVKGLVLKPGDIEGKRGCTVRRQSNKHWVYNQHFDKQGHPVGLECISSKNNWWLDTEIRRPPLRDEDWMMAHYFDQHPSEDWQVPWAWEYECWREWQPRSDFDRWRKAFRHEVKRLQTSIKLSRAESEGAASVFGDFRLPSWLMRGLAKFLPGKPWTTIPNEVRKRLLAKSGINPDSRPNSPPSLEGSVSALKRLPPNTKSWIPGDDEALRAHSEWMAAPGYYNEERVDEYTPGYFGGTYVIHVRWYHPDHVLRAAFDKWLEKHAPQKREVLSVHGESKQMSWLRELGALRLLRKMGPDDAVSHTWKTLRDEAGVAYPLFADGPRMKRAADMADKRLARFWGIASETE